MRVAVFHFRYLIRVPPSWLQFAACDEMQLDEEMVKQEASISSTALLGSCKSLFAFPSSRRFNAEPKRPAPPLLGAVRSSSRAACQTEPLFSLRRSDMCSAAR